jgi:hypothetical protein
MKSFGWLLLFAITGTVVVSTVLSGETETARRGSSQGVFSGLEIGQEVAVKDLGQRYEISVFGRSVTPLGYKIVEIGPDYLAVKDITGINMIRIPIYSIKSVVTVNIDARPPEGK